MPADTLTGYLTWAEFNALVDSLCPLESKRIFGEMNADGSSVYYRKQIRQAVLDLANFIPEFSKNNETIYYPQDFATDGEAGVGAMPPMSRLESAWYYSVDRQQRFPVVQMPWEQRFQMTTHEIQDTLNSTYTVLTQASINALAAAATINLMKGASRQKAGLIALSPKHDQFYVYPRISGEWVFSLFWDGQKLDYRDAELVPFEEEAAFAVALWVQAQFTNYIDRDTPRAGSFMAQYNNKRSNIYTRTLEKG